MFSTDDTIVAISTPMGRAGLGVVRVSGPDAAEVAARLISRQEPLVPRHATFATFDLRVLRPKPHGPDGATPDPAHVATPVPSAGDPRPQPDVDAALRADPRPHATAFAHGEGTAAGDPRPQPLADVALEGDPRPHATVSVHGEGSSAGDPRPRSVAGAAFEGDPRPQRLASAALSPGMAASAGAADVAHADERVAVRDQVVVTFFPGPHSYTGDNVVEISAHGSPVVLQEILRAAIAAGARLAQPGEFTLRAFLNGKLDLVQAEAVADLIDAVTPLQARAAFDQLEGTLTTRIRGIEESLFDLMARLEASLDFPDEGYHFVQREGAAAEIVEIGSQIDQLLAQAARGRIVREGAQIAIVGTPNVGKSSLFNALLNANRAIVTPIPGTTRDLLTERADIQGIAVSLVDTAGLRESADVVEREGVARARQAVAVADLTLLVLDRSRALSADDRAVMEVTSAGPRVVVINKIDLAPAWSAADVARDAIEVSVKTGEGVDLLIARMAAALGMSGEHRDQPLVSNVRYIELLRRARGALARANDALRESNNSVSEEFVLADLQDAAGALQEITGQRTTDDLLAYIFARFCIGK